MITSITSRRDQWKAGSKLWEPLILRLLQSFFWAELLGHQARGVTENRGG